MANYAVTYTYGVGSESDRDTHRPEHKDFLSVLHDSGRLRVSGPLDGGVGALLIIDGDSAAEIEALLDADPFYRSGLIKERTVREWTIVFGGLR